MSEHTNKIKVIYKLIAVKRVNGKNVDVAWCYNISRDKEKFRKNLIKAGIDFDGVQSINETATGCENIKLLSECKINKII